MGTQIRPVRSVELTERDVEAPEELLGSTKPVCEMFFFASAKKKQKFFIVGS